MSNAIRREDVFPVFLSILEVNGFMLIVTDTAANVGRVTEVVKRLDVEPAADEVHLIQLQYADASYLAGILNHVFAGARLTRPPVIVAGRRNNYLVIRARRSELEAIGRLLGHD